MPPGRPKGSLGKKKTIEKQKASRYSSRQKTLSPLTFRENPIREKMAEREYGYIGEEGEPDLTQRLENVIEKAIDSVTMELRNLQKEFSKELKAHAEEIEKLKKENKKIKQQGEEFKDKLCQLEKAQEDFNSSLNKQERFSRRNNIRIVGYKTGKNENCIAIAKEVFEKVGLTDCCIERAHRDGRTVEGRDRHILVKVSFFQNKLFILKNARKELEQHPFFITDDYTAIDLREKKKWSTRVSDLYKKGTRLRFQRGLWRREDGRPFNFAE